MIRIDFENTGKYITAFNGKAIVIRCDSDYTDLGDDEPLPAFVARHGGAENTMHYLSDCYRDATGP